jgi:DedD protein
VERAVQKPAAAPEAPAAAPAQAKAGEAGRLGDWVVQMGSFSSEQNALRLRERLRKAGFVTQVEKVVVGGKTLFRVRVGPYLERSEADRDKQKISETLKLEGRVLSYP